MSDRTVTQLAMKVAMMESDMNALLSDVKASRAETNAALDRLRADMAQRDTRFEKELRSCDKWLYRLFISVLFALVFILAQPYFPTLFDAVSTFAP